MYLKIFFPFLMLLVFQIFSYFTYGFFTYRPSYETQLFILANYVAAFLSVLIACVFFDQKIENRFVSKKFISNIILDYVFALLALLFLLRPIIVLFGIGFTYDFEYLRINYYQDESLQILAYGSMAISALTNFYLVPLLWFYILFISNSTEKRTTIIFYFILLMLVLFNLSYGGRFNIYFSLIVIFIRNILLGGGVFTFIKKYILLISSLVFVSFIMMLVRTNQQVQSSLKDWFALIEYHILPTFILSQKIDDKILQVDGFPSRVILQSINAPFLFINGGRGDSIPYIYYPKLMSDFTLYSDLTNNYYNAYSTLFAYFFVDYGWFSPIFFCIFVFYIFFVSLFLSKDLRVKYLSYFAFMLYISLFQAPIFSPGAITLLVVFPLLYFVFKKR